MLTVYSRIVVPYDDSELSKKALKMAMTLASQDEKVQLYVVMVIPAAPPSAYLYPTMPSESQRKEFQVIRENVEEQLQSLKNQTSTFVLEGNPAPLIVEFVKKDDGDFIIMGSRGLSGLKEVFLGSVSHYVVQKATCPVLIVK